MTIKQVKRCSVISYWEMQIKIIVRYHYTSTMMTKIQKTVTGVRDDMRLEPHTLLGM
jgi:hypothetical protein